MKKIIILIGVGLLIVGAIIFQSYSVSSNTTVDYKLNNRTYKLLKAETPVEWEKGLMDVRKPTKIEGMIFLFPDKQIRNFWNKNTFVDLDLYWLDEDKIVGQSFLPSIEKSKQVVIVNSMKPVNKVIEIIK
jgi:uncharacterized protein